MALSGSIDFSLTASELITAALRTMGVLRAGQAASSSQTTVGMEALNILIKSLQNRGLNLFALEKTYLFLEDGKQRYTLSSSGDHWTTSFNSAQIATAGTSGDASIEVDSIVGISDGDYIGIKVDDGTMRWTTVNGSPSGTTVALDDVLDDDVSVDAYVYNYTTKADRPMNIDRLILRDVSNNDTPVSMISLKEYSELTTKNTEGIVNTAYFDPQRTISYLNIWPTTNNTSDYLVVWVQRTLQDIDASTNDLDFPQEWYKALRYQLAADLAPEFPKEVSGTKWKNLEMLAAKYLEEAEWWDSENGFSLEPSSVNNQD